MYMYTYFIPSEARFTFQSPVERIWLCKFQKSLGTRLRYNVSLSTPLQVLTVPRTRNPRTRESCHVIFWPPGPKYSDRQWIFWTPLDACMSVVSTRAEQWLLSIVNHQEQSSGPSTSSWMTRTMLSEQQRLQASPLAPAADYVHWRSRWSQQQQQ